MSIHLIIFTLFALVFTASGATSCSPGNIFSRGFCSRCPKGTYQPFTNQTTCFVCPEGMVATLKRRTECEPCPKFSKPHFSKTFCVCDDGRAMRNGECKLCPRGTAFTRYADNSTYCRSCEEGTFQSRPGQSQCLNCPPGTSAGRGGNICLSCGEGQFASKGKCDTCPPGREMDEYANICTKCSENTFKAKNGKGPCLPCPVGSFSLIGASECVKCPEGTAMTRKGKCKKCPPGTHFDKYSSRCQKCGENEFMPYENVEEDCFECDGPFFSLPGASECIRCPRNTVLVRNGTCIECPPGYQYEKYDLACTKCGVNMFSRTSRGYIGCEECPKGSFSRQGSTTCFTCPKGQAFIASKNKCETCGRGKEYDSYGATCSRCSDGYYKPNVGIESCITCDSRKSNSARTACVF